MLLIIWSTFAKTLPRMDNGNQLCAFAFSSRRDSSFSLFQEKPRTFGLIAAALETLLLGSTNLVLGMATGSSSWALSA